MSASPSTQAPAKPSRGVEFNVKGGSPRCLNPQALVLALDARMAALKGAQLVKAVDLRLAKARAFTPNGMSAARGVLRAAALQGVANWLRSRQGGKLKDLEAQLAKDIMEHPARGRMEELFSKAARRIQETFRSLAQDLKAAGQELADAVAEASRAAIKEHHGVDAKGERRDHGHTLVMGATVDEHFDKLASDFFFRFRAAVRTGVAAGDPPERLASRVLGGMLEPVKASGGNEPGHPFWGNQYSDGSSVAESDAKSFSAAGAYKEVPFFHHTKEEHLESIHKEGLRKSNGIFGRAVYLTSDESGEGTNRQWTNTSVKTYVNVGRVEKVSGFSGLSKLMKKLGAKDSDDPETFLPKAGIDALEVTKEGEKPWLVVFDPAKVKVVKSTAATVKAAVPSNVPNLGASGRAMGVFVRLLDQSEGSLDKVVQAAVEAFAHEGEYQAGEEAATTPGAKAVGWQWVAVLDNRTCEQCQSYDGVQWDADFAPVGDSPPFPDDPPLHFNCRCTVLPVDLASEPAPNLSFEDYLSQFTRAEQEQVFGKAEVRRYRRGDITAGDLVGGKENMISIEQFRKLASGGGK